MTQVTTITCDQCGADVTYTGNSVDYRIALSSERKPLRPDAQMVTDMMIYPPVPEAHFCSVVCLCTWAAKMMPDAAERYDQMIARRPLMESPA